MYRENLNTFKLIGSHWLALMRALWASELEKSDFGMYTYIAQQRVLPSWRPRLSQLDREISKSALPLSLKFLEGVWEAPKDWQNNRQPLVHRGSGALALRARKRSFWGGFGALAGWEKLAFWTKNQFCTEHFFKTTLPSGL